MVVWRVKTNINGTVNVISACLDQDVKRVVAISTDKASGPISLYGATKLASEKLFIAANDYSHPQNTVFSIVRFGNIMGSRGSVIPMFYEMRQSKTIPITDLNMTRFLISPEDCVDMVWRVFHDMVGGEIYVKRMPSMKISDLAKAIAPDASHRVVGIRSGEKLHEQMIGREDAPYTYCYNDWC